MTVGLKYLNGTNCPRFIYLTIQDFIFIFDRRVHAPVNFLNPSMNHVKRKKSIRQHAVRTGERAGPRGAGCRWSMQEAEPAR